MSDALLESSKSHVTYGYNNGLHESHTNNMENNNSIEDEDLWKEHSDADTIILTDDDRSFDDISIEVIIYNLIFL